VEVFSFEVGFSPDRPIVPDQRTAFVVVASDKGLNDARLAATQMVATHSAMPTSVRLISVEI